MTTNASHVTEDLLSAYVDEELAASERLALEEHLGDCLSCQYRLEGLRKVVGGLRSLERAAAPASLAGSIQRHLALDESHRALDRYRLELPAAGRLPTHGFVIFAVIIALAAMLFLFAEALEVQGESTPSSTSAAGTEGTDNRRALVDGRTFEMRGGLWIEQGIDEGIDPAQVSWTPSDSALGERLVEQLPGLRSLLDTGGGAILEWEGEPVGLRAPPSDVE